MFGKIRRRPTPPDVRDADGPLAAYGWLWRALERSHPGSRWMLRLTFVGLVVHDLALLAAWFVVRPFAAATRSRWTRPVLAGVALVAAGLLLRPSPPLPPREEPAADSSRGAPVDPRGFPIPHAQIGIGANGAVRFEGQFMRLRDMRSTIVYHQVHTASMEVERDADAGWVSQVRSAMTDSGIRQADFTTVDKLGPRSTPPAILERLARPLPPTAR